jgi:lipopolysaccharide/colanic/teichoic acid biosynthesis glycosyltransferase
VFKRTVDVISAAILLALSLPLLAVSALVIKFDSDGPVLFRQARMGRRFRTFQLFKLRTMNLWGEGPAYTLGADPRITRAGRWLRRYKLDELPQLWNVLRGDMSMVGPRPVIPELALEFASGYEVLLTVRPGLTDPASLKYRSEAEILEAAPDALHYFKTVVTPDKIRISKAYLQHANAWSDFVIVIRTAVALGFPNAHVPNTPPPLNPVPVAISKIHQPVPRVLSFPNPVLRRKPQSSFARTQLPDRFEIPVGVLENSDQPRSASNEKPLLM